MDLNKIPSMHIIYNNIIPFKGFKAINICGVLFVRKSATMSAIDINHEAIHTAQIKECLVIGFYLIYVLNWFVNLFRCEDGHAAYRKIKFEQEAYNNEANLTYLTTRKHFAWIKG